MCSLPYCWKFTITFLGSGGGGHNVSRETGWNSLQLIASEQLLFSKDYPWGNIDLPQWNWSLELLSGWQKEQ